MRRAVVVLAMVAVVMLVLGAALGLLAGTQAGTRVLLRAAQSAGVQTTSATGSLLTGLDLGGLRWHGPGTQLRVDRVQLRWQPAALLAGTLDITTLGADGVDLRLTTQPPDPQAAPPAWPQIHLPLRVRVRELRVRDVHVKQDGAVLIAAAHLTAAVRLTGSTLHLEALAVQVDGWQARLAGQAVFDARGDVQARLEAERPDAARPVAVTVNARGAVADALELDAALTQPLAATLKARVAQVFAPGAWSARLELPAADLGPAGAPPGWSGGGVFDASGTGRAGQLHGTATLQSPLTGPLKADLNAQAQPDGALVVQGLTVTSPAGLEAVLSARAHTDMARPVEAKLRWKALAWPLNAAPVVRSARGDLGLDGTPDAWHFTLDADLAGSYGGPGTLAARGDGTRSGVTLHDLTARALGGELDGTAQASWSPAPQWQWAVKARNLDPGTLYAQLPGRVSMQASGSGRSTDAGLEQAVDIAELGGTLRGQRLGGGGSVRQTGARIEAQDFELRLGDARVQADGSFDDALHLTARVPDLHAVWPDARGRLALEATAHGPVPALVVDASAQAAGLEWGDWRVRALDADLALDRAADRVQLTTTLAGLAGLAGSATIQRAQLSVGPAVSAHTVALAVQADAGAVDLSARGGLDAQDQWTGSLTQALIEPARAGRWTLTAPAPLAVSAQAQRLGRACLAGAGDARVCAQGQRDGPALDARLDLTDLPLALAQPWLGADTALSGALAGQVVVRAPAPAPAPLHARVRLRGTPGAYRSSPPGSDALTVPFGAWTVQADCDSGACNAAARIQAADAAGAPALLDVQARGPALNALSRPDAPLAGRAAIRGLQLAPLGALSVEVANLAGTLEADAELAGTVGRPVLTGNARVRDARADLPRLGIAVKKARFSARADASQRVDFDASAESGKGSLRLAGHVLADPARGFPAQLTLDGENFTVADIPDARVAISPALRVQADAKRVEVRGTVEVPSARLTPTGAAGGLAPSPDVQVVGAPPPPPASGPQIDAQVTVRLGKDVRLRYAATTPSPTEAVRVPAFTLDSGVAGEVVVRESPGRPTRVSGEVRLDEGKFSAYGQKLDITEGELRFADQPPDNPGLRVQAQRKVGEVTAGVRVRGRAQNPVLTVFSDPAMAQEEALSYLVLGRPLRGASQAEGSMLARAATALGVRGGDQLAQRIGSRLGLDEVSVGGREASTATGGTASTAVQVGKYLSPRLYVGYGVGLFDRVGAFALRFDLTERWVLEASSGVGQAVDLLYTRER